MENSSDGPDDKGRIDSPLRLKVVPGCVIKWEQIESGDKSPHIVWRMGDDVRIEANQDEKPITEVEERRDDDANEKVDS